MSENAVMQAPEAIQELHKDDPSFIQWYDAVHSFLLDKQWSMTRLAKSAGTSATSLSQVLNNKYPGDVGKIRRKVTDVIERERSKDTLISHRSSNGIFIETSSAKRVLDAATHCHLKQKIGVICARAGYGKTEGVREYARRHTDVVLIEADPGYTAATFFKELHNRLGNGKRGNLHEIFDDCVDRLSSTGRLVIIDEAEQLPYRALEMVRRLHDKAGIGILMTGMPRLFHNLRGIKGEFEQLYSRVSLYIELQPLKDSDIQLIVSRCVGDSVGNAYWKQYKANSDGRYRRLAMLIEQSILVSDINNTPIDKDVIQTAAEMLLK